MTIQIMDYMGNIEIF